MEFSIFSDQMKMIFQEQEKCQPAQSNLYQHQYRHKLDHIMFRTEHNQKVKRTRQIIGIQGNKIRSQSQIPGILQTSAGS